MSNPLLRIIDELHEAVKGLEGSVGIEAFSSLSRKIYEIYRKVPGSGKDKEMLWAEVVAWLLLTYYFRLLSLEGQLALLNETRTEGLKHEERFEKRTGESS